MAIIKIQINNKDLVVDADKSFLSADVASGASTITVDSINKFAINKILIIGEVGNEKSEVIKTHASSAPSGSTVTLASNTVFAHSTGTPVYLVDYDQYELSHATTATGSKTTLTTTAGSGIISVDAEKEYTLYNESEYSSGYYFVRKKNSIGGTFSGYSDAIAYTGLTSSSVGYMIDRALRELGVSISDKISTQDCHEWINDGLRFIQGKLKRWPEHYSYNAVLGQITRGTNKVTMPTDAYDTETNKSIIGLRIGTRKNLTYLDPRTFDNQMDDVAVTQVTTQATSGSTTLEIDNSYDFTDSGSVNVYISGTKYTITYTGVTRSATAGILTGVPASGTGSIAVTIPVDTYVWQNEEEGIPLWFTVRNGSIEFYPLADANEDNKNMYGDYSKVATSVDSDGDTIDYQRYDMVQSYLLWKIKMRDRNNGNLDQQDGYYIDFKERLNDAIRTLPQNNKFPMSPTINRMYKRMPLRKANLQDLNINDQ